MSNTNAFSMPKISLNEFRDMVKNKLIYSIKTGKWDHRPMWLHGTPGSGKSATIKNAVEIAKEVCGLEDDQVELTVVYAPQLIPTDISGLPWKDEVNQVTRYLRQSWLPESNSDKVHIIVIEELSSSSPSVQVVFNQLMLDRTVGFEHELPEKTLIMAVGNLVTDKGHVFEITSPLANRCQHMEGFVDIDEWLEWASTCPTARPEVTAYHRFTEGIHLSTFNPKQYGKGNYVFASPRSWEAVMTELSIAEVAGEEIKQRDIQSHIGLAAANHFLEYIESIHGLTPPETILKSKDPTKYVPEHSTDGKTVGRVYFLVESVAAYMCKRVDDDKIFANGLNFFKAIGSVWGNSIAIIGIIYLAKHSLTGKIAKIGGSEIIKWLGSAPEFSQIQAIRKALE